MTKTETSDAPPTPDERPSMLTLAKKMDAALRAENEKRATVNAIQESLEIAKKDHAEAVEAVSALKAQYDALMQDVMSFGGTVHVAS